MDRTSLYDVSNYSDEELYQILELHEPSDRILEAKLVSMMEKYSSAGEAQLLSFFNDIYHRFFMTSSDEEVDEEDEDVEEEEEEEDEENITDTERMNNRLTKIMNTKPEQNIEGFSNITSEKKPNETDNGVYIKRKEGQLRMNTEDLYKNGKVEKVKGQVGNNERQISQIIPDTINAELIQYPKGVLNPTKTNTIQRIISIDSQYRNPLYIASDYAFDLSEPLKNVVALKLYSVQIPYSWYTVTNSYGGNFFYLKGNKPGIDNGQHDYKIIINPSTYDKPGLISTINEAIGNLSKSYPGVNFGTTNISYSATSCRSTINVDIKMVYNEMYYQLYFPVFEEPGNGGKYKNQLNSFLGFSSQNTSIYSIYSTALFGDDASTIHATTTKLSDIKKNPVTFTQLYNGNSLVYTNNNFHIFVYSLPTGSSIFDPAWISYDSYNNVTQKASNICGHIHVKPTGNIDGNFETVINYLNSTLSSTPGLLSGTQFELVSLSEKIYLKLSIKLDRNKININDINLYAVVVFPNNLNWLGDKSFFQFPSSINYLNNIRGDLPDTLLSNRLSSNTLGQSPMKIILKCVTPVLGNASLSKRNSNALGLQYSQSGSKYIDISPNDIVIPIDYDTSSQYTIPQIIDLLNTSCNDLYRTSNNPDGTPMIIKPPQNFFSRDVNMGVSEKLEFNIGIDKTFSQIDYDIDLTDSILYQRLGFPRLITGNTSLTIPTLYSASPSRYFISNNENNSFLELSLSNSNITTIPITYSSTGWYDISGLCNLLKQSFDDSLKNTNYISNISNNTKCYYDTNGLHFDFSFRFYINNQLITPGDVSYTFNTTPPDTSPSKDNISSDDIFARLTGSSINEFDKTNHTRIYNPPLYQVNNTNNIIKLSPIVPSDMNGGYIEIVIPTGNYNLNDLISKIKIPSGNPPSIDNDISINYVSYNNTTSLLPINNEKVVNKTQSTSDTITLIDIKFDAQLNTSGQSPAIENIEYKITVKFNSYNYYINNFKIDFESCVLSKNVGYPNILDNNNNSLASSGINYSPYLVTDKNDTLYLRSVDPYFFNDIPIKLDRGTYSIDDLCSQLTGKLKNLKKELISSNPVKLTKNENIKYMVINNNPITDNNNLDFLKCNVTFNSVYKYININLDFKISIQYDSKGSSNYSDLFTLNQYDFYLDLATSIFSNTVPYYMTTIINNNILAPSNIDFSGAIHRSFMYNKRYFYIDDTNKSLSIIPNDALKSACPELSGKVYNISIDIIKKNYFTLDNLNDALKIKQTYDETVKSKKNTITITIEPSLPKDPNTLQIITNALQIIFDVTYKSVSTEFVYDFNYFDVDVTNFVLKNQTINEMFQISMDGINTNKFNLYQSSSLYTINTGDSSLLYIPITSANSNTPPKNSSNSLNKTSNQIFIIDPSNVCDYILAAFNTNIDGVTNGNKCTYDLINSIINLELNYSSPILPNGVFDMTFNIYNCYYTLTHNWSTISIGSGSENSGGSYVNKIIDNNTGVLPYVGSFMFANSFIIDGILLTNEEGNDINDNDILFSITIILIDNISQAYVDTTVYNTIRTQIDIKYKDFKGYENGISKYKSIKKNNNIVFFNLLGVDVTDTDGYITSTTFTFSDIYVYNINNGSFFSSYYLYYSFYKSGQYKIIDRPLFPNFPIPLNAEIYTLGNYITYNTINGIPQTYFSSTSFPNRVPICFMLINSWNTIIINSTDDTAANTLWDNLHATSIDLNELNATPTIIGTLYYNAYSVYPNNPLTNIDYPLLSQGNLLRTDINIKNELKVNGKTIYICLQNNVPNILGKRSIGEYNKLLEGVNGVTKTPKSKPIIFKFSSAGTNPPWSINSKTITNTPMNSDPISFIAYKLPNRGLTSPPLNTDLYTTPILLLIPNKTDIPSTTIPLIYNTNNPDQLKTFDVVSKKYTIGPANNKIVFKPRNPGLTNTGDITFSINNQDGNTLFSLTEISSKIEGCFTFDNMTYGNNIKNDSIQFDYLKNLFNISKLTCNLIPNTQINSNTNPFFQLDLNLYVKIIFNPIDVIGGRNKDWSTMFDNYQIYFQYGEVFQNINNNALWSETPWSNRLDLNYQIAIPTRIYNNPYCTAVVDVSDPSNIYFDGLKPITNNGVVSIPEKLIPYVISSIREQYKTPTDNAYLNYKYYYNPFGNEIVFTTSDLITLNSVNNKLIFTPAYDPVGGVYSAPDEYGDQANDIIITIVELTGNDYATYTKSQLTDLVNIAFSKNPLTVGSTLNYIQDPTNNKYYFQFNMNINKIFTSTDYRLVFYDIYSFIHCQIGVHGTEIINAKRDTTLGWMLGFRELEEYPLDAKYSVSVATQSLSSNLKSDQYYYDPFPNVSFSVNPIYSDINQNIKNIVSITPGTNVSVDLYNYFLITLDEFAQSRINDGLVTVINRDLSTETPSYMTIYRNNLYKTGCDNEGDPIDTGIIKNSATNSYGGTNFDTITMTQKQIYSATQLSSARSSPSTASQTTTAGVYVANVFALIPIKISGLTPGDIYSEFGGSLQNQTREYFGPVDIRRIALKLVTDKGDIVDLNGHNWSISFICEQLYNK